MTKATAPHLESSPVSNKEAAIKHSRQSRKQRINSDRREVFPPAFSPGSDNHAKIKTPPPLARQAQTRSRDVHEDDDSEHGSANRLDFTAVPPSSTEGHASTTTSSVIDNICRMVIMPPISFPNLSRSFPGRVISEFMPWSAASNSFVDLASIVNQVKAQQHPGISASSVTNVPRILNAAHFPPATFPDPTAITCASLPFLANQERIPTSTKDCKPEEKNGKYASDHQSISNQERWANLIQTIPQTGMMCLACPEDRGMLNDHLIFVRQQIEFFQATMDDIMSHTRGRSKSIAPLQVGIRCRHCSHIPAGQRTKGSTYFPSTLLGIYQAAQNINVEHLQSGVCLEMPEEVKIGLSTTRAAKTAASGIGKAYWAESARTQGFVDTEDGIRFACNSLPLPSILH